MTRFLVLLTLALLTVVEVAAVLALVEWLGGFWTALLLAADVVVGMMVLRWAVTSPPPERGWRLAAGGFIVLPGFVLDLVGIFLLIPGPRDAVAAGVSRRAENALRRRGVSVITVTDPTGAPQRTVVQGDVIQGEIVEDD